MEPNRARATRRAVTGRASKRICRPKDFRGALASTCGSWQSKSRVLVWQAITTTSGLWEKYPRHAPVPQAAVHYRYCVQFVLSHTFDTDNGRRSRRVPFLHYHLPAHCNGQHSNRTDAQWLTEQAEEAFVVVGQLKATVSLSAVCLGVSQQLQLVWESQFLSLGNFGVTGM
ncbi:hypothetical protein NEUTE2DRAFT_129014 [Neurospora tetrasperma FGSC 2509]|nr:hypothetical protein NEUTE2DRAFT_129014 [Neurospora tetrasperma FGSC 2509]